MEHTHLRTRRTSPRLAFANHMNGLVTSDCTPGSPEGAKMLTRADPALNRPMILFQNIVEILHRSMAAVFLQRSLGFQLNDGWRVSCVLVGVDDPRWRPILTAQGLAEKALGRPCIAFGREEEVDRRAARIHCPI